MGEVLSPEVISVLAHRRLPVQAPVDDAEALDLIRRLRLPPDAKVIDVGCGMGGWVAKVLTLHPDAQVLAFDTSEPALAHAKTKLSEHIAQGAVALEQVDVAEIDLEERADLVVCIGAEHAFGGVEATLGRLLDWVAPGGQVLFGTSYLVDEPTEAALEALGGGEGLIRGLDTLRTVVRTAGFVIHHEQISSLSAWDRYEEGWVAGLDRAADAVVSPITGVQLLSTAEIHERRYQDGYRGQLHFVVFELRPR